MNTKHFSETPATAALKKLAIDFTQHSYSYVDHGGTTESAKQLGVEEHCVIKTLVMQTETAKPLIILMHGDCTVSTKNLARCIGAKKVEPCSPDTAQRHTGYQVGGTSPFGIKKAMPIYAERTLFDLPHIYINGGKRGYLVRIHPHMLLKISAIAVDCANSE